MLIKMIALDLDDTLLKSDLSISEANRLALRDAEDSGIEIVLASGRSYPAMERYVKFLELDRPGNYLVCSNGAEIYEADTARAIDRLTLPADICMEASRLIVERGFNWQVYADGIIFCDKINPWALHDRDLTGLEVREVGDWADFFAKGRIKFVIPGDPEKLATLSAELADTFAGRAEVITSKPYFLELLPLGADKGSALSRLAERLGIGMDSVMAVGDAMNDFSMVKAAGWGCAPANAIDAIKNVARVISKHTNEEDAVADLVRTIALS